MNVFENKDRKKAIAYVILSEICFVVMFFLVGQIKSNF